MAEFVINQDVETDTPTVEVTISDNAPLQVGRHRFRLIVVDDSGNRSVPDEVTVFVIDDQNPTAVLRAPESVSFGESFPLDGRRSVDAGGGRIVNWVWTYLGPTG